jgi:magnesium chelatase family protein
VRCAIQNAGLEFPNNKRITVNLAPADLPKDSGRFDLPIAMGILAASGQVAASQRQRGGAGRRRLAAAPRPGPGRVYHPNWIQEEKSSSP